MCVYYSYNTKAGSVLIRAKTLAQINIPVAIHLATALSLCSSYNS